MSVRRGRRRRREESEVDQSTSVSQSQESQVSQLSQHLADSQLMGPPPPPPPPPAPEEAKLNAGEAAVFAAAQRRRQQPRQKKKLMDSRLQTESDRIAKRSEIRAIASEHYGHRESAEDFASGLLHQDLDKLNKANETVLFMSEAKLDSEVIRDIGSTHVKMTQKSLKTSNNITMDAVMTALKTKFLLPDDEGLDWYELNQLRAPFVNSVPALSFMNGPIQSDMPERQSRKVNRSRLKRPMKSEILRPKLIVKNEEEKSQTDARVETLHGLLVNTMEANGKEWLPMMRFAVNPDPDVGFSQTIENLFDISFLIRNGLVAMQLRNGIPCVTKGVKVSAGADAKPKQMVFKFNYDTWQKTIEAYKIKECGIPTRPPPDLDGHSRYYSYGGGGAERQDENENSHRGNQRAPVVDVDMTDD